MKLPVVVSPDGALTISRTGDTITMKFTGTTVIETAFDMTFSLESFTNNNAHWVLQSLSPGIFQSSEFLGANFCVSLSPPYIDHPIFNGLNQNPCLWLHLWCVVYNPDNSDLIGWLMGIVTNSQRRSPVDMETQSIFSVPTNPRFVREFVTLIIHEQKEKA